MTKRLASTRALALTFILASAFSVTSAQSGNAQMPRAVAESAELKKTLEAGNRVLLVETIQNDVIVFGDDHNVAGPVSSVLTTLGFQLITPPGERIAATEYEARPLEILLESDADHVFLMNFSQDEKFVGDVQSQLARIVEGRIYRIDATVAQAFSERWNESELAPEVAKAILDGAAVTIGSDNSTP